jgi:CRISPR system Cascade subunit CasD
MRSYLLFQLYGPVVAWGDIAVGEYRPTHVRPSKSAVLGLVAAALGIRRHEEREHAALVRGYCLAVRQEARGELLRDYHTVQTPPERRKRRFHTRDDELAVDDLYTITSQRDYRVDAAWLVALWAAYDPPQSLEALGEALRRPRLTPYLGRKSCPPALPFHPKVLTVDTLQEAFDAYPLDSALFGGNGEGLLERGMLHVYWEALDPDEAGLEPTFVYSRRDRPLSRTRWQFEERDEYYAAAPATGKGASR